MLTLPFPLSWIGLAIAVAQTVLLFVQLRRKYPAIPKRVPSGLRFDGRPRAAAAKAVLWFAPAVLAAVLGLMIVRLVRDPPPPDAQLVMLFVFLTMAEVAWFVGWTIDRQIELARGMTHRIAPMRMLLSLLPILATIAVTIVVAAGRAL